MLNKKMLLLTLPLAATLSLSAANPFDDPFFNDPFGDDIFKEMMLMQKNMDQMFERMQERRTQRSSRLISPLGTYRMAAQSQLNDKGDHYELLTNIPESKENHINITSQNGTMSISAKIVESKESKTNGMVSRSSSMRMYQQAVPLPADADEGAITTQYKNGKLLVSVGKKKGLSKPNTVQINGVTQKITTDKKEPKTPEKNKTESKTPVKNKAENAVPITKEFDQTPVK